MKQPDHSSLDDVFTAAEAALLWGLEESTVKRACQGRRKKKFAKGEARKSPPIPSGKWIVTRSGMERLYPHKVNKIVFTPTQMQKYKISNRDMEIINLRNNGATFQAIGKKYSISKQAVQHIYKKYERLYGEQKKTGPQ